MIQDILPSKMDISFISKKQSPESIVMSFKDGALLSHYDGNEITFPRYKDVKLDGVYIFSLDGEDYFLNVSNHEIKQDDDSLSKIILKEESVDNNSKDKSHFEYITMKDLRRYKTSSFKGLLVAFTAYHLNAWYETSRFCGKCGHRTVHDDKERAMVCPDCGNRIYPRINPAVIIGVKNGDRILITKYRTGYAHNALVAGFTEIGETLEDTVRREVMEEVGIKVKNITYYKSQPWGIALDLLAGFYCEVDGDDTIIMDENELKYAEWVERQDIVLQPTDASLTNEMMKMFKEGKA
ncbi:MAG: NAD(+) diphosphatase [Lachnospiraceae bacterium]|nr:NAD(+) diphosphatase [Lachnospiraceae bacterium]